MKVSETIYSDGHLIIPMADVQHIEKKELGISVITKHTRWDMDADCWSNSIWIGKDKSEDFIKAWCYYRYEFDGMKEAQNDT